MKNVMILLMAVVGFVGFVFLIQATYLRFSNTVRVIENTNQAVEVCGENKVKSVSTTGFECVSKPQNEMLDQPSNSKRSQ